LSLSLSIWNSISRSNLNPFNSVSPIQNHFVSGVTLNTFLSSFYQQAIISPAAPWYHGLASATVTIAFGLAVPQIDAIYRST
jgi:hypothetical protein